MAITIRDVPGVAKIIYEAYPSSDLLPITAPMDNETLQHYYERLEQELGDIDAVGDTLFVFLLRELSEADTAAEAIHMLDNAIDDISSVRTGIVRKLKAYDGGE